MVNRIGQKGWGWLLVVLLMAAAVWVGCKEKNVPFASDKDELIAYFTSSPDAQDLFRTTNLFSKEPYTLPGASTIYIDSVVSVTRQFLTEITDTTLHYENLGWYREAYVIVQDDFLMHTTKINGVDTTTSDYHRGVRRLAYFIKIANDSQPFLGWLLYGFNGFRGSSATYPNFVPELTPVSGETVRMDSLYYVDSLRGIGLDTENHKTRYPKYIKVRSLLEIAKGSLLEARVRNFSSGGVNLPRAVALLDSSTFDQVMISAGSDVWVDTVKTLTTTSKKLDFVTIHFLNKTTGAPSLSTVFLPYRFPQPAQ
jgi:hypothetical protein